METCFGFVNTQLDALLVVYATKLSLLPGVVERPKHSEKARISNGSIFCFSEEKTGMKRWTDGKTWSPSKVLGQFLVYREISFDFGDDGGKRRFTSKEKRLLDKVCPSERYTLHKKTISITLEDKLYHVIAYYVPFLQGISLSSIDFFDCINHNFIVKKGKMTEGLRTTLLEKKKEYEERMSRETHNIHLVEEIEENAVYGLLKLSCSTE